MDTKKLIFFSVSLEELQTLISEAVKKEVCTSACNPPRYDSEFLTRKEVSKILRISLPTLNDYVMRSIIPAYRIGNNVRFLKEEVLNNVQKIQAIKYKTTILK